MGVPRGDMMTDAAIARAFNRGSDARLKGLPRTSCPYSGRASANLYTYWHQGWLHIDQEWPGNLPPVQAAPLVNGDDKHGPMP